MLKKTAASSGVPPNRSPRRSSSEHGQRPNKPEAGCGTLRAPRPIARVGLTKTVRTPAAIIFLFEFLFDDLGNRQIFLDGGQMPKDPNPTWMGYSSAGVG